MFFNRWIVKQTVVQVFNRILISNKNEQMVELPFEQRRG